MFQGMLDPTGLTSQQGKAVKLPTRSISIKILLHDAQTNVLQHEVQKLFVAVLNNIHLRGHGLLSRNKMRQITTHASGNQLASCLIGAEAQRVTLIR